MIQGIFYARFLPKEALICILPLTIRHSIGPHIVAQSPPGCITSAPGATKPPLIDWDVMQEYIMPRKAFFNRYMTVQDPEGKYAVLGFPVLIPHEKYQRNEFIFNFGIVLDVDADQAPYEPVVRRLAVTFKEMEKQNEYLSQEGSGAESGGVGPRGGERRPIETLLEIVKEDLNNYGECMIPVDDANTINMKLFPHHATPPQVKGWHVPVAKMKFAEIVDPTWDLTMQKVVAHIDGVNDVRRIAWAADVSLDLAKLALRHLLYYDTVLLLDMFFFGSCYAPRPGIHDFVADRDGIVDECAAYVCIHARQRISNFMLIKLMTSFCVGKSVMEWLRGHQEAGFDVLRYVDVRRLVQFGVIKGCLYRAHKYVVSKQYLAALATGQARPKAGGDPLQKYTDGCHTFDQIITENNLTDAEIMEKLKALPVPSGDLTVFYR
ncbi:hypothetical protein CcaCcLH18_00478 [Colletotrichum camelliae]|nr:hypothetical protein CcaCcLH18_00478 [Colletotrichum camelliae]